MTNASESIKLPENFNPGIIDPIKRRKLWKTLLLSIIPGLGHIYTGQKRLALAFFVIGVSVFYCALHFQMPYLIALFEVVLLISATQSTRTYLFRNRYKYLGGVHAWDYRSW